MKARPQAELEELRALLSRYSLPGPVERAVEALVEAHASIGRGIALRGCVEARSGAYMGCVAESRDAVRRAISSLTGRD